MLDYSLTSKYDVNTLLRTCKKKMNNINNNKVVYGTPFLSWLLITKHSCWFLFNCDIVFPHSNSAGLLTWKSTGNTCLVFTYFYWYEWGLKMTDNVGSSIFYFLLLLLPFFCLIMQEEIGEGMMLLAQSGALLLIEFIRLQFKIRCQK